MKTVLRQKAPFDVFRATHVALTTARMALAAVLFTSRCETGLHVFSNRPHAVCDSLSDGGNGKMEACRSLGADVGVTLASGVFRIGKGGIFDEARVGGLPVRILGVAAMAVGTGDLSVIGIKKSRGHINLFIGLQRSQRPPSALARIFRRQLWFTADFLDFPA